MSLAIVNTWPLNDATGYGPAQANIANTAGHALVAFVAVGSNNGAGQVMRLSIADDAHNWWVYSGTALVTTAGQVRRVDIWACANAQAATTISLSASMVTAGLGGFVCEVSGFPQYAQPDFVLSSSGKGHTTTLGGTQPGASDFLVSALFVFGDSSSSSPTITPPVGYTPTAQLSFGNDYSGDTGNFCGMAAILPAANPSGVMSLSWNWTAPDQNFSSVMVGFKASPTAPTQPNPNFPGVKVEAAFGYQPGNTSGAMPTWTDISARAQDAQGSSILQLQRGRDYELTQPEAGTLKIGLENQDGAFNPTNSSSPYFPNVLPEVPVRLSAFWNGQIYGLGYFYASKWPQDFPDRQWGRTTLEGGDLISTISQGSMPSAYAGEVLADGASSYYPLGEFYDAPHGSLFNNLSRTNQKPMVGYSPPAIAAANQLQTGQTMGLAGDDATGIGVSGLTAQTSLGDLPGAFVLDDTLPPLNGAAGITVEGWMGMPSASTLSANPTTVLSLYGAPQNYPTNNGVPNGVRVTIEYQGSTANTDLVNISLNLYTPAGVLLETVPSAGSLTGNGLVYFSFTIQQVAGQWTLGGLVAWLPAGSTTISTASNSNTQFAVGILDVNLLAVGGLTPYSDPSLNLYDYAIGQVAIYPYVLAQSRTIAHASTGLLAASGDMIGQRVGKLMTWSGLGVPFGLGVYATEPNPLLGNADQIAGGALADALYATSQDEGGMYYAPATATGEVWYAPRMSFYNKPSVYTFGDNGTTETPYLPGTGFDFSDTYLYNIVSSQRTISTGQQLTVSGGKGIDQQFNTVGADAIVSDQASEAAYFPRGPLQLDIETTSDADAFDRANWALAKYKQAQLRANQILLDCASNPALFPVALGIEQGDIVTVNRRPIGWATPISVRCVVQMVQHAVGPDQWDTTITLAPYFPDGNVLQCDNGGFNLAGAAVGW